MYHTLHYGRPFRTLNVIDESNREILAIEIDISLSAVRVVRTLEQLLRRTTACLRRYFWTTGVNYAPQSLRVGTNLKTLN